MEALVFPKCIHFSRNIRSLAAQAPKLGDVLVCDSSIVESPRERFAVILGIGARSWYRAYVDDHSYMRESANAAGMLISIVTVTTKRETITELRKKIWYWFEVSNST